MHLPSISRTLFPFGLLALAMMFASCQSSSTDSAEPTPTGERTRVVAVYSIKKSEPHKNADSLT